MVQLTTAIKFQASLTSPHSVNAPLMDTSRRRSDGRRNDAFTLARLLSVSCAGHTGTFYNRRHNSVAVPSSDNRADCRRPVSAPLYTSPLPREANLSRPQCDALGNSNDPLHTTLRAPPQRKWDNGRWRKIVFQNSNRTLIVSSGEALA